MVYIGILSQFLKAGRVKIQKFLPLRITWRCLVWVVWRIAFCLLSRGLGRNGRLSTRPVNWPKLRFALILYGVSHYVISLNGLSRIPPRRDRTYTPIGGGDKMSYTIYGLLGFCQVGDITLISRLGGVWKQLTPKGLGENNVQNHMLVPPNNLQNPPSKQPNPPKD